MRQRQTEAHKILRTCLFYRAPGFLTRVRRLVEKMRASVTALIGGVARLFEHQPLAGSAQPDLFHLAAVDAYRTARELLALSLDFHRGFGHCLALLDDRHTVILQLQLLVTRLERGAVDRDGLVERHRVAG